MPLTDKLRVTHTVCRLGQPLAVIDNLPGEGAEMTPIQLRQLASAMLQAASDCEAALDVSSRYGARKVTYVLAPAPAFPALTDAQAEQFLANGRATDEALNPSVVPPTLKVTAAQFEASSLKRAADMAFRMEQAEDRASLERLYSAIKKAPYYETLSIGREAVDLHALNLLGLLDGLTVADVRQVLSRAGFWLDAVSTLNCGEATEFARAVEGLRPAAGESL